MFLHFLIGLRTHAASSWLALLLTYCGHAVAWTAAAALLDRRKGISSSTLHWVWTAALLGPLVTTTVSGALDHAMGDAAYMKEVSVLAFADSRPSIDPDARIPEPASPSADASAAAERENTWARRLTACALGASLFGLMRYAVSALLLWRSLLGRMKVDDPRLRRRLRRLSSRIGLRGVVLTESSNIASPLVIGASEICVPRGRLTALTDGELDTVFAHELAHLERRDGLWFPVVGLLQSVLWFQVLNHWAASRIRHTAELSCDERAVELTGDPLVLANALVRVAAGALLSRPSPMVPTMARSASTLRRRVERLADAGSGFPARSRGRRAAIASLLVIGIATASSSIRTAQARPLRTGTEASIGSAPKLDRALDSKPQSLPDVAALSKEMADLVRRDRELETEIQAAIAVHDSREGDAEASAHLLELRQELRHVRAAQIWTEERAAEAATTSR